LYRLSKLKPKYIAAFFLFILLVFLPFKDAIQNLFIFFAHKPFFLPKNQYLEQIEQLKGENLTLKLEREKFCKLRQENEKLKKAFDFKSKEKITLLGAQIIAFTPSLWRRSALLNRGINEGIEEGSFVIDEEGNLLGRISEVKANFSCLIFTNDPDFNLPVFIGKETLGLLKGNLIGAKILYIEEADKIEVGDAVRVKVLPSGSLLTVGEVKKIIKNKNDLFWDIDVKLAANNAFLKQIFIIK